MIANFLVLLRAFWWGLEILFYDYRYRYGHYLNFDFFFLFFACLGSGEQSKENARRNK